MKKNLYFIGIAGSAMGNVAVACARRGFTVSGSDSGIYPPMSTFLEQNGIQMFQSFHPDNIQSSNPDMVIIGNAISRGNPELEYVLNHRISYTSMPAVVHDELIAHNTSIVITGTHGKTTTTSIAAWIFEDAGKQPGFLIGGMPNGFDTGCRPVPDELHNTDKGIFVIEGDEYDTAFFDKRSKFFHYSPTIVVINAIEFDHADIFDSLDDIRKSFKTMIRLIPSNGYLITCADFTETCDIALDANTQVETFGLHSKADWHIADIKTDEFSTVFTVYYKQSFFGTFTFSMSGEHNIRNAVGALASCFHAGLSAEEIKNGLATFKAPKRRMEEIAIWNNCIIIDDFAHHPTAISETVKAIKAKYPHRDIIACFEPRSNTTTRNIFQKEFAECFDGCKSVIIGPVNRPERYKESERLNIPLLLQYYSSKGVQSYSVQRNDSLWGEEAIEYIKECAQTHDIIVLMSNGNIGGLRNLLQ